MKPGPLPFAVNDIFESPVPGFPEAPGPVVFIFFLFIDQEDFLISEFTGTDHMNRQAKAGTSHTGNYVIVCI
jgi:hypothetical protein